MLTDAVKRAWRFPSLAMCILVAALVLPTGCGGKTEEKSEEDIEKSRQQHVQTMQREMQEAGGGGPTQ